MAAPTWFAYVLWSDSTGRTYVGVTTDLARRLRQHNGELVGGASATRRGRPWLAAVVDGPLPDRGSAQRREYVIKRRRGRARLSP